MRAFSLQTVKKVVFLRQEGLVLLREVSLYGLLPVAHLAAFQSKCNFPSSPLYRKGNALTGLS